jgi:ABC-type Fe3+-citrate transport system substrate-binding protein
MRRVTTIILTVMFLPLAVAACGTKDETPNVSEDQMNHYAGVPEHDHPTNSATSTASEPTTPDPAKKQ